MKNCLLSQFMFLVGTGVSMVAISNTDTATDTDTVVATVPETVVETGWAVPATAVLQKQCNGWLSCPEVKSQNVQKKQEQTIAELNITEVTDTRNGAVLASQLLKITRVHPEIAVFLDRCDDIAWKPVPFGTPFVVPELPEWVLDWPETTPIPHLQGVLRFYLANQLLRAYRFDEAQVILDTCTAENTVDPAAVLLAKSLCAVRLSDMNTAAETLTRLDNLESSDIESVPRRFTELAKMLKAEMPQRTKDNTAKSMSDSEQGNSPQSDREKMDGVLRQMEDVQRQLGQGSTGKKVQNVEKDILKTLDDAIEKLEKQLGDGQKDGENSSAQSRRPGQTERVLRLKAPGNVETKDSSGGDWGNLPPKEREAALMQIEKEFPSHYRAVIEAYFRQTAQGNND